MIRVWMRDLTMCKVIPDRWSGSVVTTAVKHVFSFLKTRSIHFFRALNLRDQANSYFLDLQKRYTMNQHAQYQSTETGRWHNTHFRHLRVENPQPATNILGGSGLKKGLWWEVGLGWWRLELPCGLKQWGPFCPSSTKMGQMNCQPWRSCTKHRLLSLKPWKMLRMMLG